MAALSARTYVHVTVARIGEIFYCVANPSSVYMLSIGKVMLVYLEGLYIETKKY